MGSNTHTSDLALKRAGVQILSGITGGSVFKALGPMGISLAHFARGFREEKLKDAEAASAAQRGGWVVPSRPVPYRFLDVFGWSGRVSISPKGETFAGDQIGQPGVPSARCHTR